MKRIPRPSWMVLAAALAAGGARAAAEPSPREAMQEGRRQLQAGDLPSAAAAFDRAAQGAPAAKLDPARARYNQGLALQQEEGKDAEAEAALDQALRTTDTAVQARALYNRGHLLAGRARVLQEAQKLPEARGAAGQALSAFADSLLLAPADDDARVNYEMTGQLIRQIEEQIEQQKQQQQEQQQNQPQDQPQQQDQPQKPDQQDSQQQKPGPSQQQPQEQKQDGQPQPQPGEMNGDETPAGAEGEENPEDMSKEEALMLLDAMKAEEAAMREKMRLNLGKQVPVDKDW